MAGMCELVVVLSRGQYLVCASWLLFCQEANGWCVSWLLICQETSGWRVSWLLFCQEANGWCV